MSGKRWRQKEKDSKITLTQESSHFVPAKFSDSFFKQFDLAVKLRREELKKQGVAQTPGHKMVCQVKGGSKKKKIPK